MAERTFSKRSDYYEELGNKLRELSGFAALGRELLQNARDARATVLRFHVRPNGLIVENDSEFKDCGQAEEVEKCPWHASGGRSCDFHRFRKLAGGEKRAEEDAIGAFGIGFTSVFQITDAPHLVSAGRHWLLREDHPEDKRFTATDSCGLCGDLRARGVTRFWLPWARDPQSGLRKLLRAGPVPDDVVERLAAELRATSPGNLLFLDAPATVEVIDAGGTWTVTKDPRAPAGVVRIAASDGEPVEWHVLEGDFAAQANELKRRFPTAIEPKRKSVVRIAFRRDLREGGLLHAFLPTEVATGLPFHVHADFLPDSSRKHVELGGSDAQGEWNRAALAAAARLLGRLGELRGALGPESLWAVVGRVWDVCVRQKAGWLSEFWTRLAENASAAPLLWSSAERWEPLTGAHQAPDETAFGLDILRELGMKLAHPSLKPYWSALQALKVDPLTLPVAAGALRRAGATGRRLPDALPAALRRGGAMGELRSLVWSLAPRTGFDPHAVEEVALALGSDGAYWPLRRVHAADDETRRVFGALSPAPVFLAEELGPLQREVPSFGVEAALAALERLDTDALAEQISGGAVDAAAVVGWFASRPAELRGGERARRLAALPLFACGSGYRPLSALSLPSDFRDPLGVADLVDLEHAGAGADFLRDVLEAEDLDVRTYARTHAPHAFGDARYERKRDDLTAQLALRLVQLQEDESVRSALMAVRSVRCVDGQFRSPGEVHFASDEVTRVLGDVPVVRPQGLAIGVASLYEWLGVAREPRVEAVMARIEAISSAPLTAAAVEDAGRIFSFVARHLQAFDGRIPELRRIAWLPAEGCSDQWYTADKVQATLSRWLFASQGRFLDVPYAVQQGARDLLEALEIAVEPTIPQIVAHVRHLVVQRRGEECIRVLAALDARCNDQGAARAVLPLGSEEFFWCDGRFFGPQRMFWGEHPFGRRAVRLPGEPRTLQRLLQALGVQERPTAAHCLGVLQELSSQYGAGNHRLPREERAIALETWRYLGALAPEERAPVIAALRGMRSYPNADDVLARPEHLLIGDAPELARRFQRIRSSIVERIDGIHAVVAEAGARALSAASEAELVDSEGLRVEAGITERLEGRRVAVQRVVGVAGPKLPSCWPTFVGAARLTARWTVRLPAPFSTGAEDVRSVQLRERDGAWIYFVAENGTFPWLTIARELAAALAPGEEPGRLAAALEKVLEAEDAEAAGRVLDELGFHSLSVVLPEVAAGPTAARIDPVDGPPAAEPQGESPPEWRTDTPQEANPAGGAQVPQPQDGGGQERSTRRDATSPPRAGAGPGARGEDPGTGGEHAEDDLGAKEPANRADKGGKRREREPSKRSKAASSGPRTRKRTYVVAGDGKSDATDDDEAELPWSAVDRAGVKRVLRFEHEHGRHPRKMRHHHPGYDVESRDADGNLLRYIEVKSHAGDWGDPQMSRRQFRTAQALGERYWLYVVERAEGDDFRITCIQDPANQVGSFVYDDGWMQFHDDGEGRQASEEEWAA